MEFQSENERITFALFIIIILGRGNKRERVGEREGATGGTRKIIVE